MKKALLAIGALLFVAAYSYAQAASPVPSQIGVDSAQQNLKEVSINSFEDPGFWKVSLPEDAGLISARRIEGAPSEKKALPADATVGDNGPDKYVLGVKAEFYGRTNTQFSIEPVRPLVVPGITKTISLWVVGRNFNHKLSVIIEDYFNHRAILPLGTLNFTGWKQLTAVVPPTVEQRNPHFSGQIGIKIVGLLVEPELTETYGSYFIYFDALRVVTDLFTENNRDPDDIPDNW